MTGAYILIGEFYRRNDMLQEAKGMYEKAVSLGSKAAERRLELLERLMKKVS